MFSLCVYCASSENLESKYYEIAARIGVEIARKQWTLVYGGGRTGMMGVVACGTKQAGGRVVGVIPEFMKRRELEFTEADELISVLTIRERKMLMERRADAFVALPGGWGTLEELMEILTLAHLEALQKPVVIFNFDGYYDGLLAFFERIIAEKFMHTTIRKKFAVAKKMEEVFLLIETWKHQPGDAKWYMTR